MFNQNLKSVNSLERNQAILPNKSISFRQGRICRADSMITTRLRERKWSRMKDKNFSYQSAASKWTRLDQKLTIFSVLFYPVVALKLVALPPLPPPQSNPILVSFRVQFIQLYKTGNKREGKEFKLQKRLSALLSLSLSFLLSTKKTITANACTRNDTRTTNVLRVCVQTLFELTQIILNNSEKEGQKILKTYACQLPQPKFGRPSITNQNFF